MVTLMDAQSEEEVEPLNKAAVEKPGALHSDGNAQQGVPVEIHPPHAPQPLIAVADVEASSWLRDPDGYIVVLASPDGSAGTGE